MALLIQILVTGLAAGAGYGLVAIGVALIYRLTGVIHFALGELITLTVFVTLFLAVGTAPATRNMPPAKFALGLVAGLAVAAVSGLIVYLIAVRPFARTGAVIGWIGAIVAVAFAVRGGLAAALSRPNYVFPDLIPFDRMAHSGVLLIGGVSIPLRALFVFDVGVVLAALAVALLERTDAGKALQAIASDDVGARAVGLPVDRLLALAFGLAGVLAGLAAVVAAPSAPVSVDTGALLGLKGLAAALLGRFGPPWSVFGAGLVLGVIETAVASLHLGPVRLGPEYRDIVPLVLAVIVMAARGLVHAVAEDE
jgi:branched-chain amino acid transport system permease protein